MQDRRNAGLKGYRTGKMQDWKDARLEGCRSGGVQDWRKVGKKRVRR